MEGILFLSGLESGFLMVQSSVIWGDEWVFFTSNGKCKNTATENGFAPVDIRTTFETETSGEGVHPIKYEVSALCERQLRGALSRWVLGLL
jgi:hypothetical protein